MMAKKAPGRKKGGHNKGYFFRKGRGWFAVDGSRQIPLRYEDGVHIKDPKADEGVAAGMGDEGEQVSLTAC